MALESAIKIKYIAPASGLSHKQTWPGTRIGSIVVSISVCHAEDSGSIPCRGVGSELMTSGAGTNKLQLAVWLRVYIRWGIGIASTRHHWGLILGPSVQKIEALPPSTRGRCEFCKHHIGTKNRRRLLRRWASPPIPG